MQFWSKELLGSGSQDIANASYRKLYAGKNNAGNIKYLLDYWDINKYSLIITPDTGSSNNQTVSSLVSGTLGRPSSVVRFSNGETSNFTVGGWLKEDWKIEVDGWLLFNCVHPGLIVYCYACDPVTISGVNRSSMCFKKNPYKGVNFFCDPDYGYGPDESKPTTDSFTDTSESSYQGWNIYYRSPADDTVIDLT